MPSKPSNPAPGDEIKPQKPGPNTHSRGSSIQGDKQDAKGGPAGANQGGAPRGGSRAEPSHLVDKNRKDQKKKEGGDAGKGANK